VPAVPVHHRHQIHKPSVQSQVGDVRTPHLVRMVDHHVPQQIRIPLVRLSGGAQTRFGVDRLQPHQPHQPAHPLDVDRVALPRKPGGHPLDAVERPAGVGLVDEAHQPQVFRRLAPRLVVEPRAGQPQQRTLPPDRKRPDVSGLDHAALFLSGAGQTFF